MTRLMYLQEEIMLKIVFGDIENSIYHPPTYFDNQYEDEWIMQEEWFTDTWNICMKLSG